MASTDDPKGYYRVLGLAPNASPAQIVHAYREWAKRYHPDASGREDASEFIRIKEAYDTLSDPIVAGSTTGLETRLMPNKAPPTPRPRPVIRRAKGNQPRKSKRSDAQIAVP